MPIAEWQTNFTKGELTQRTEGRTDVAGYKNGAECLWNFAVQAHGGAAVRAGSLYVGPAKDPTVPPRLVGFIFSASDAYVLEFGALYIRFWKNRALLVDGMGVPIEVVTPYLSSELSGIRFDQSADVLYLAHANHPPAKLERLGVSSFLYVVITFNPPATAEIEFSPAANLTLGALTGSAIVFTADTPVFLDADVNRQIKSPGGRGIIVGFTSTTIVTVDILDAFSSLTIGSGDWTLDGSPVATVTPSLKGPVNAKVTLTLTVPAVGWRATDVGGYVKGNDGIVLITGFTSSTIVEGQIKKEFATTSAIVGGNWSLEEPSWSAARGYPAVVRLHSDQRLYWAATLHEPDTIWGSVVGDYENLGTGIAADDALVFVIASTQVNLVRWLLSQTELLGATLGGEFSAAGSAGPLTPTDINIIQRTSYGTDELVQPIKIDHVILYVQRGGRKLREMVWNWQVGGPQGGYVAPDISLLSEHLMRPGVTQMVSAKTPDSLVFLLRTDGVMNVIAYERNEEVVGWSHHSTAGLYESLAVIPNSLGTGDEVWHATSRTLGSGATVRYLEVFDGFVHTDCAAYYAGPPATVFGGLAYLEGLAVKAIGDDGTVYDLTVTGGTVTLPDATVSTTLEVGLDYPTRLVTLRPDSPSQTGTIQTRLSALTKIGLRLYCTSGRPLLDGEPIVFEPEVRHPVTGEVTDFTGDVVMSLPGSAWDRLGRITVSRAQPKPLTVLAVRRSIEWDDG